ncbi:MAG: glycerol-3-phosphate dehydrogenase [Candidatus Margulisiibacteriota bacterium]
MKNYDVAVIGGGINGAGIARELAYRGLSVALFEQDDFAAHTSSASSKMLHGGLRYLEQAQFKLVFEALHERLQLLKMAPHLVKPLAFVLPIYKKGRRPAWLYRFGVWLYDRLAGKANFEEHVWLSKEAVLAQFPGLKAEGLMGAIRYWDAQMDDARLCLENVLQARQFGADVFNYTSVTQVLPCEGGVSLTLSPRSGEGWCVVAKEVVLATGAWADQILVGKHHPVRPSKGIHVVVNRPAPVDALVLESPTDARIFFILPWQGLTLIGTTDADYAGDLSRVQVSQDEILSLLAEANAHLDDSLSLSDVISAFAGLRPLLSSVGKSTAGLSREHRFSKLSPHLWMVSGGKYTTYRLLAETVAQKLWSVLGKTEPFADAKSLPLYGGEMVSVRDHLTRFSSDDLDLYSVSKEVYGRILRRYGSAYPQVLERVVGAPDGQMPLGTTEYVVGEVIYMVQVEMAQTLLDVFRRRTVLLLLPDHGRSALESVLKIMAHQLNWSDQRQAEERAAYEEAIHDFIR